MAVEVIPIRADVPADLGSAPMPGSVSPPVPLVTRRTGLQVMPLPLAVIAG